MPTHQLKYSIVFTLSLFVISSCATAQPIPSETGRKPASVPAKSCKERISALEQLMKLDPGARKYFGQALEVFQGDANESAALQGEVLDASAAFYKVSLYSKGKLSELRLGCKD